MQAFPNLVHTHAKMQIVGWEREPCTLESVRMEGLSDGGNSCSLTRRKVNNQALKSGEGKESLYTTPASAFVATD